MYDLTCINGMANFDLVAQWLVLFSGTSLAWRAGAPPRSAELRKLGQPPLLREIVMVNQNLRGPVVIDDTGRLQIDELRARRRPARFPEPPSFAARRRRVLPSNRPSRRAAVPPATGQFLHPALQKIPRNSLGVTASGATTWSFASPRRDAGPSHAASVR
jgi:hypothetical protein